MTVVYLEAILMPNLELIHFGKSLGFVSERQAEMVKSGACKLSKGSEPIVSLKSQQEAA